MSQVQDLYDDPDDFENLLNLAEGNAANDWEQQFVSDLREKYDEYLREKYDEYGKLMYLSDEAYAQGYAAAEAGQPESDCPVMRGELCIEWVKGWKADRFPRPDWWKEDE